MVDKGEVHTLAHVLALSKVVPPQVDTLASQACLDELRDEVLHRCVLTCPPFSSVLLLSPLVGSVFGPPQVSA